MKMRMSAILGKAKTDTENIRGLNLAAVKHTTFQVVLLLLLLREAVNRSPYSDLAENW
jgi:hypothetical protein